MPAVMTTAAMNCMPLNRIFVCMVAAGKSNGPPKERIRAVIDTDRNTVAGVREKRRSNPKKPVATKPAIRIARTGVISVIGPRWELYPSNGMRYCSP